MLAIIGVLSIGGLNAASMVAIEAVARAATSADGTATVNYATMAGMSLPTGAQSIIGYHNGQVEITVNGDYPEVATLIHDLSGARMAADCTAGTACTLNTLAGTKNN